MEDKKSRRGFFRKLAVTGASLAAAPLIHATQIKNMNENTKVIKQIRALGFQWETKDPFLFCVHHEDKFPKGNEKMGPDASLAGRNLGQDFHIKDGWRMYHGKVVPGFPGHPHRGFETLTVVREGMVDHSDSVGGLGRYGDGDLQWMTAGKGILHSEMFPLIHQDKENPMELFQIWLNLPAKSKMASPDYKMFWSEEIPKFHPVSGVLLEVLAGELLGEKSPEPPKNSWAHNPDNHVGVYNIHLEPGAEFVLPASAEGVNRTLYYYQGRSLSINQTPIREYHAVDVESTENLVLTNGEDTAKILVLQGKPIGEPVVQHGPFVMNSRQEIQEAFQDYQNGAFGSWPWDSYDHVHPRGKGRFAAYPDGRNEERV
jgi:redox-sensitive bicupin YhaK (pirin superfamily)